MVSTVNKNQPSVPTSRIKDVLIWSLVFLALAVAIVANHLLNEYTQMLRVVVWLLWLSVWAAIALRFTSAGKSFAVFARAAYIEMLRVTWPTRQDTIRLTGIVIISSIAVSFCIWVIDAVFYGLLSVLMN